MKAATGAPEASALPPSEAARLPDNLTHGGQAIPGTVYIVDKQQRLNAKHSSRDGDIVLVPTPSNDPDDPLNWSRRRKLLSTFCTTSYVLLEGISTAAVYSVLVPISKDTGLGLDVLNQGTGYMVPSHTGRPLFVRELEADLSQFLLFGWGCLFWQPVALQYGKRPVYLFSLAATLAIMVWQPYTKTSGQYLASKVLQGFFGAPIESLAEISYADVWFQHERGRYFGLYGLMLAGSNFFAPVIMGFVDDGQNWEWVFYWCAVFCGIALVLNFFLMEETNYYRPPVARSSNFGAPGVTREDAGPSTNGGVENTSKEGAVSTTVTDASSSQVAGGRDEPATIGPSRKTYLQKLSLIPPKQPFRLWKVIPRPFLYLSLPAVVYSGFSYGATLIWFNVLNATASSFLSAPPYGFSSSLVGLSYVSPLIGTVLAGFYSGNLGDRFVLGRARRNAGVFEAESRLWLFALSCLVVPLALLLWGVGAARGVHWFALVFAMGLIGVQASMGVTLAVSYAMDSYPEIQGEAMVTVIVIRNTMSFAVNYAINPWIHALGVQNAMVSAAVLAFAGFLTFLPMIRYGKRLRVRSTARYWRFVEQERALGLAH